MNKEQITSIIRAIAILLVSAAGMFGLAIDEQTAQLIVIGVAMLVIIAYGLWKNHNITANLPLCFTYKTMLLPRTASGTTINDFIHQHSPPLNPSHYFAVDDIFLIIGKEFLLIKKV